MLGAQNGCLPRNRRIARAMNPSKGMDVHDAQSRRGLSGVRSWSPSQPSFGCGFQFIYCGTGEEVSGSDTSALAGNLPALLSHYIPNGASNVLFLCIVEGNHLLAYLSTDRLSCGKAVLRQTDHFNLPVVGS